MAGCDKGEESLSSDRRTLLLSGIAAATAIQAASAARAQPAGKPALDGEMHWDEAARAAAADDFGHIVHEMPNGVLRPASAKDVAATIRWAAERGGSFAAQGQRHSVFGRSMAHDGVLPSRCIPP